MTDVDPRDVSEELLVIDYAYYTWEVLRLRRLKANLLHVRARRGMVPVIAPLLSNDTEMAECIANNWYDGGPGRVQDVKDILSDATRKPLRLRRRSKRRSLSM